MEEGYHQGEGMPLKGVFHKKLVESWYRRAKVAIEGPDHNIETCAKCVSSVRPWFAVATRLSKVPISLYMPLLNPTISQNSKLYIVHMSQGHYNIRHNNICCTPLGNVRACF